MKTVTLIVALEVDESIDPEQVADDVLWDLQQSLRSKNAVQSVEVME